LIHVSTDVVFGGRRQAYTEADATTPASDYGVWKAEAERAVTLAHPGALILRISLLYGTSQLATIQTDVDAVLSGRSPMRFFTDEYRCPAAAYDVAMAISGLALQPDLTGILHLGGPQVLSRADLARWFARWQGHDPSAVPTASIAESGQRRAGRIELDSSRAASLGFACRPIDEVLPA
jgi:dTDP-4-dehydrorhamnose reductase